jgi:hypothetical protein
MTWLNAEMSTVMDVCLSVQMTLILLKRSAWALVVRGWCLSGFGNVPCIQILVQSFSPIFNCHPVSIAGSVFTLGKGRSRSSLI